MDRDYIDEHQVISRYVLDQLTDREEVEFELYYLDHPDVLDEVEIERGLRAGLQEVRRDRVPAAATDRQGLFAWLGRWFQMPAVLAANFGVIAMLALLAIRQLTGTSPVASLGQQVWIGEVRGEEHALKIDLRSDRLVLELELPYADSYDVSLNTAQGRSVASLRNVHSDSGVFTVVLDSNDLKTGTYQLNVSAPDGRTLLSKALAIRSD